MGTVGQRLGALWSLAWCNRTKVVGYAGAVVGSAYMAVQQGQHWQLTVLGCLVAAIGHYNDHANRE